MTSCRLSLVFPVMAICMLVTNFAVIHKFEFARNDVGAAVSPVLNVEELVIALQQEMTGCSHSIERGQTGSVHDKKYVVRSRDDGSPGAAAESPSNKLVEEATGYRVRNGTSNGDANATLQPVILKKPSQSQFPSLTRFPKYGTDEFNKECSWLLPRLNSEQKYDNCTLLAKLYYKGNEGVSDWANKVAETHQLAVQTNCRFLMDYGVNHVDIQQIFTLATPQEIWTVPSDFNCNKDPTCIQAHGMFSIQSQNFTAILGKDVVRVPQYRMAYVEKDHPQHWYRNDYLELRRKLPGLSLESSMACSMQSLLELAPTASKYEPRLFTDILPTLQQPDAFIICLYIRTGRTDKLARDGKDNTQKADKDFSRYEQQAESVMSCAQHLEQQYLANNTTNYSKSVWMVITDAPYLKEYISQKHNATSSNRIILTTGSRGVHSRPLRKPSIHDVAEALIDWYLIGESSLVVSDGSVSFGETAALRTSRPLYTSKCKRVDLIHEGTRKETKKRRKKK